MLLFEDEHLHSFLNLIIALKLSMAAAAFSLFLQHRFLRQGKDRSDRLFVLMLSAGYALSHYCVTQSSNIMWLDGVYMLPLMILAVYEAVNGVSCVKLAVFTGISILLNWYTAGINCLFAILWMIFEIVLKCPQWHRSGIAGQAAAAVLRFGLAMALGVMLSAVLFLPTIAVMLNSNRGSLDLGMMMDCSLIGDFTTVLSRFALGTRSDKGFPSLYCGSLALLGCAKFFIEKRIPVFRRIAGVGMLAAVLLILYFNPLVSLFSLLKNCTSYWYRYSYVGIFAVLTLAGAGLLRGEPAKGRVFILSALLCTLFIVMNRYRYLVQQRTLYISVLLMMLTALAIEAYPVFRKYDQRLGMLALAGLMVLSLGELGFNAKLHMDYYSVKTVGNYQQYTAAQKKQIDALEQADPGQYRINQTHTRNMGKNGLTANYNEALGYNYWSISGYTSSPDDIQRNLLDRLGYPICGENLCVVNTSILPADSLLGVRYVLTSYEIPGLVRMDGIETQNGKNVYRNPFALPMAFTYESDGEAVYRGDPFVYQNELYSMLLGEPADLYIPLESRIIQHGDLDTKQAQVYTVEMPKGDFAVYGSIPYWYNLEAVLNVNAAYQTSYSTWLSPNVFFIPDNGEDTARIELQAKERYGRAKEAQFYALDIERMAQVSERIAENQALQCDIRNGYARIETVARAGQNLYVSIPYDRGWRITRNGVSVEPELFAQCMMSIPLEDGANVIEMCYSVPLLGVGTAVTVLSMALLAAWAYAERRLFRLRGV